MSDTEYEPFHELSDEIIDVAVRRCLLRLKDVTVLRPEQLQTVKDILHKKNIFKTAPTGSGKTLPPCLVPAVIRELQKLGVKNFPGNPHVMFLTPLNSIRDSLVLQLSSIGISACVLTKENPFDETCDVHFITPEVIPQISDVIRSKADQYQCIVIDEVHQFKTWAASKFRKIFSSLLYGGSLTLLGAPLLLQTATATEATRTFIKSNIPEVRNWTDRLTSPARSDVVIIIPDPSDLTGNVGALISPHLEDLLDSQSKSTTMLVLVRSVKRGAEIFLEIINKMSPSEQLLIDKDKSPLDPYNRTVAFYHRNSSPERKTFILNDLSLHEGDPDKKLKVVVSTLSLGLGVDISVYKAIIFGLPEEIEGVPQETGRVGRHRSADNLNSGQKSLIYYYHKGSAENFHCNLRSTSRQLITPMPICQNEQLYKNFDSTYTSKAEPCFCCYPHMKKHYTEFGCIKCRDILHRYCFNKRRKPSIMKQIKIGIEEFCESRGLKKIPSSNGKIEFSLKDFKDDLVKIYDEITNEMCLVKYYGLSNDVASVIFSIIQESMTVDSVCFDEQSEISSSSDSEESECFDEHSDISSESEI